MPHRFIAKKNSGDHEIAECNHKLHGQYIHNKLKCANEGKEKIKIREQKECRDIVVPHREPLEKPSILPRSEFLRLKKQAHVISPAERKQMLEDVEARKQKELMESDMRREKLKKAQLEQNAVKGSVLEEVETDAREKNQYLLNRAFEMQQEQEDEIKGANRIILASKCLAIREAQIAEKRLIQKELEEEERRLDMMMEQQRQIGLFEDQKKREQQKQRNHNFVVAIKQQLKDNEIHNLIEAERREEEAKAMQQTLIALQEEEQQRIKEKKRKQLEAQNELKKINEDMEKYKAMEREEERISDARLKEYMRQKEIREKALEQEKMEAKLAKEREVARMRSKQDKDTELQEKRDEMNAFRIKEEAERKWRKKEMEEAIRAKQLKDQLRKDREKQIDEIRRAQAIEQARDEEEFNKVAKMQYDVFIKELDKSNQRKANAIQYRKDILKQVGEREKERIEERKSRIEEGQALRIEQDMRDSRIKDILKKKLGDLRQSNVPDHTVNGITRQIKNKYFKT